MLVTKTESNASFKNDFFNRFLKSFMIMSVYLKTDFKDYYDHMFNTNGMCLERMSVNNFSRGDMFTQLANMGLATPGWGSVVQ